MKKSIAPRVLFEKKKRQRGRRLAHRANGGERIRKVAEKTGGIKEERIYLGTYEIYRKFVSGSLTIERTTVHVSDDTGRIAMLEERTVGSDAAPASLQRYIYSNHLQSASLELDENADIISYEEYHPFGTTAYQASNTSINAVAKRYRYTGKERDEETGLYYHGARYYIPWLARWTAVDALENEYAPWAPYCYIKCNPINDTDSTGMGGDNDNWRDEKFNPQGQAGKNPDGQNTLIPDNAIPLLNDKGQIEGYIGYGNNLFTYVNDEKQKGYIDSKGLNSYYYEVDYETYQEYKGDWRYHLWSMLNKVGEDTLQMLGNPEGWAKDIWHSISNIDIGETWDAIMSMDNYGKKALATSVVFGLVTSNPKRGLWTLGKETSAAKNAFRHWKDHGYEFPHLQNAVQYAKAAKDFLDNIPKGALIKVTKSGDIRIWDKVNNIFGSYTPDGTPKTYFKLNPKSSQHPRGHGYPTNQDYWNSQPGNQFIVP